MKHSKASRGVGAVRGRVMAPNRTQKPKTRRANLLGAATPSTANVRPFLRPGSDAHHYAMALHEAIKALDDASDRLSEEIRLSQGIELAIQGAAVAEIELGPTPLVRLVDMQTDGLTDIRDKIVSAAKLAHEKLVQAGVTYEPKALP